MLILHLILTAIWAFVAHFSYQYTSKLPNGWSQLSAYTLGTLALLPPIMVVHSDLKPLRRDPLMRLVVAHALAYLAFGLGTVLGWYWNPYPGPRYNRRTADRESGVQE